MMPNQGEQGQTRVIGGGGETEEEPMSDLCSAKCKIPDAWNLKLFRKLSISLISDKNNLSDTIICKSWLSYDYPINILVVLTFI